MQHEIKIFPTEIKKKAKGKLVRGKKIKLGEYTMRRYESGSGSFTVYDIEKSYSFLKKGDIIKIEDLPDDGNHINYIEITDVKKNKVGNKIGEVDEWTLKQYGGEDFREGDEIVSIEFIKSYEQSFKKRKKM